jgi:hypothetical protein
LNRDGKNSNAGGGGFAGLYITGVSNPVVVSGIVVFPGVDDDNSGINSPQIGIKVESSANVEISGGYVHARITAIQTDAGNGGNAFSRVVIDNVATATGYTNDPQRMRYNYDARVILHSWYLLSPGGTEGTTLLTQSRLYAFPFQARGGIINTIATEVTTLGASSTIRCGLYADNGSGKPGALIVDFAYPVASDTTGVKDQEVYAGSLKAGDTYWFAVVAQGGAPTLRTTTLASKYLDLGTDTPTVLASAGAAYMSGVTGALPDPFVYTIGQVVTQIPMVAGTWEDM